jgi:HPt (histidine-containing phosphotransfer) domain-containing protein
MQFNNDIRDLGDAIRTRDAGNISKIAHSMKGASLNMYFTHMTALTIRIESHTRDLDFDALEGVFAELVTEWHLVHNVLKEIVDRNH